MPAGPVNNGIMYDGLRLELDENAKVVASRLFILGQLYCSLSALPGTFKIRIVLKKTLVGDSAASLEL